MKIDKKLMSDCVKYFKLNKVISSTMLMRKFKIGCDLAVEICKTIEKRFPNLWRDGKENFIKTYITHK